MVTEKQTPPIRSGERVLAYMIAGVVGVSLLSIVAVLVAAATGMPSKQFSEGIWPVLTIIPMPGLVIGFVLIFVLLITSIRRRAKEAPKPR